MRPALLAVALALAACGKAPDESGEAAKRFAVEAAVAVSEPENRPAPCRHARPCA